MQVREDGAWLWSGNGEKWVDLAERGRVGSLAIHWRRDDRNDGGAFSEMDITEDTLCLVPLRCLGRDV